MAGTVVRGQSGSEMRGPPPPAEQGRPVWEGAGGAGLARRRAWRQAVVGWFSSHLPGRRVSRWLFPKLRTTAPFAPWSSSLGQAGLLAARDRATGHYVGRSRRPAKPGLGPAAPCGLPPGCTSSEPSRVPGFQQRLDAERQRAEFPTVPVPRPEPSGVHAEQSRGQALTGGAGLGGAWRAAWRKRAARVPATRRPSSLVPFL